jgi:hypothetical protein
MRGRHKKKLEHPLLKEVVTSLPGPHRRSARLPTDDIPEEYVHDLETGEDSSVALTSPGHIIIGFLGWIGWIAWTIYMWFFTGAPVTDFLIVLAAWFISLVVTIVGVPLMRRRARNRVRK